MAGVLLKKLYELEAALGFERFVGVAGRASYAIIALEDLETNRK